MNWFYSDNGQQKGPVDDTGLDQLIAAGAVRPDTLVWREGMTGWQALSEVRPTAAVATATAGAGYCVECGRPFPPS